MLCCGYTLTDFPISTRLTSLPLWQSNDCPSAGKATLMNMDKDFMWNHYERLHNHNKAKHNKTVCIFIGIYCRQGVSLFLSDMVILCHPFCCSNWLLSTSDSSLSFWRTYSTLRCWWPGKGKYCRIWSSLFWVMSWHLFDANPLPELMLTYN